MTGKIKIKLAELLLKAGLEVDPDDFWVQQGAYRGMKMDLARWGHHYGKWLDGRYSGQVIIYSWDTMTEIVKSGGVQLTTSKDSRTMSLWECEVSAHE